MFTYNCDTTIIPKPFYFYRLQSHFYSIRCVIEESLGQSAELCLLDIPPAFVTLRVTIRVKELDSRVYGVTNDIIYQMENQNGETALFSPTMYKIKKNTCDYGDSVELLCREINKIEGGSQLIVIGGTALRLLSFPTSAVVK